MRTPVLYRLARPALFRIDPERAHALSLALLERRRVARPAPFPPELATCLAGLRFPSPVGLAAGYDKDARAAGQLLALGFGFVEVGTLTPRPQPGNPRPRLFRLAEDRAVINRMGFNNGGQVAARARLEQLAPRAGPVGVNIGANKASVEAGRAIEDYVAGVEAMRGVADYLSINISSPNTPGLRAMQDRGALAELLAAVTAVQGQAETAPPLFLKVAPDLDRAQAEAIARAASEAGIAALIVANTTIGRPPLRSRHAGEVGGLSGAPLAPLARHALTLFHEVSGGALPLISAGGIGSAEEAWARLKAGASLVQLYSALVYEGPGLARRIATGLAARVRAAGAASLEEALGRV